MTIVPLIPRTRALDGLWQADEMAQLLSIFAAHEAQGQAADWDTGETERREPQFYVLGDLAEQDCLVSITRIGRDYVLEDGQGHVVAEDSSLSAIADKAVAMSFGARRGAWLVARVGLAWIAAREFFEERVEPLMAESLEAATHVFPQLAVLV
jgi:hypothetical protein